MMNVTIKKKVSMTEANSLKNSAADKGSRYFVLALKKQEPLFSQYLNRGMVHFRESMQRDNRFDVWMTWLNLLLDTLLQRPDAGWLIEIMERVCLEFGEQIEPQEQDLEAVLLFLNKIKNFKSSQASHQLQVFHLAEGFFHFFGSLYPRWNSSLLSLRGELLFSMALSTTPPSLHHLQSAGHSFLQAKIWEPENNQIHADMALCLMYQACYAKDGSAVLYHMAWHTLCSSLRKTESGLPRLAIPEILLFAFVQHLSFAESCTLFRLMTKAIGDYENTPPQQQRYWVSHTITDQYHLTLRSFDACLQAQLDNPLEQSLRAEQYLNTWIEIFETSAPDKSFLAAWCKLLKSLQAYVPEALFITQLLAFAKILGKSLDTLSFDTLNTTDSLVKILYPLIENLDSEHFLTLSKGLYLILAEMLLQGWLDEDGYHTLWLDILAKQYQACRNQPEQLVSLQESLENAWLALIACSGDEHLIIDSRETLLELLINANQSQFEALLELVRNLYAMLLNRHHCDYNLANLASYLQALAEHRSADEARSLLIESCQTYAQACAIAEDDTELLMAWQSALRALAEYDPENAQAFESEADGIYRQILELMYQRS
jgi:hypothetical protein